jgi:hypothetical protein
MRLTGRYGQQTMDNAQESQCPDKLPEQKQGLLNFRGDVFWAFIPPVPARSQV